MKKGARVHHSYVVPMQLPPMAPMNLVKQIRALRPGLGAFLPEGAAVVDGGAHHGETLRTMPGARHAAQTRALGHGLEHGRKC
jgi:hypothetical protein